MSTTPQPGPGRELHLRVGTAQRERALELIRNAAADERITFDELEGRVPRALGAVTRADLTLDFDAVATSADPLTLSWLTMARFQGDSQQGSAFVCHAIHRLHVRPGQRGLCASENLEERFQGLVQCLAVLAVLGVVPAGQHVHLRC